MKVTSLKTNHLTNPLGYLLEDVVLSFRVEGSGKAGKDLARIVVSEDSGFSELFYDTGLRSDIDESGYSLLLSPEEGVRFYWKVYVKAGDEEAWSDAAWFEAGKTRSWRADFISPPFSSNPVFVKEFTSLKDESHCRCYALGLGTYEIYINSRKLGDECLLPGLHAYDKWLQSQTFEFTAKKGVNLIEVYVGASWYRGEFGLPGTSQEEREAALIAEFHIGRTVFGTGLDWEAERSPVTSDGIYQGEVYEPGKARGKRQKVKISEANREMKARLVPRLSPPITVHEVLKPTLIKNAKREYILDMGQNMTGWLCFKSKLPQGTRAVFQFGEALQNGSFCRDNLRSARAEFRYVSDGERRFVRQRHTFYGFRYVKVRGFVPDPEDFEGWVIHSDLERSLEIRTGDESVNRLVSNALWSMKGNFLDTPTESPQRDLRMGWTEDAQLFCDTACYVADAYPFYRKYLRDLWMEQRALGGTVPLTVPRCGNALSGSAGWGDAATIIPWTVYLHSGDKLILETQYKSMKAWVDFIRSEAGDGLLWSTGGQVGDWLSSGSSTDRTFIASAYYYYSAKLMAKTAGLLKNISDAGLYHKISRDVRKAMIEEYFTPSGRLAVQTETAYAVAIAFSILPEGKEERVYRDFRRLFLSSRRRITTGFIGTRFLCKALVKSGNADLVLALFLSHGCPGWLYQVDQGATTVWERWDSVQPDGSLKDEDMNSLNHCANASVLGWIVTDLLGFQVTENIKRPNLEPHPARELGSMRGKVRTPYGWYEISWKLEGRRLSYALTVPFDAEAHVVLPLTHRAPEGTGITWIEDKGEVSAYLSAGSYKFSYEIEWYYSKVSLEMTIPELMALPEAEAVLERHIPSDLLKSLSSPAESAAERLRFPYSGIKDSELRKIEEELSRI